MTDGGLTLAAFHVEGLGSDTIETMVPLAARLGLEIVTGSDWLLLIGPRSRLGALARPWVQPEPVQELAYALGVALTDDPSPIWRDLRGEIDLGDPMIIGVINVTPDSFSPSSRVCDPAEVTAVAERMIREGAGIIEVGGESTRPGATPLDPATERERVIPALTALASSFPDIPLAIDTVHSSSASIALDSGATIVNDVTAGRSDPRLLQVAASTGAGLVLSHSRGLPGELASDKHADYGGDVVGVVVDELTESMRVAVAAGVKVEQIVLDPGFGFGKHAEHNWRLLDSLDAIVAIGRPVLAAVSRKRFLGAATGREVDGRDPATAAACVIAADRGAKLFRVHSPAAVRDALLVAQACNRN